MNVNPLAASTPRSTAGTPPAPQDASAGNSFSKLLDREQAPSADPAGDSAPPSEGPQAAERSAAQRARNAKGPVRAAERPAARAPAEADRKTDTDPTQAKDAAAQADGNAPPGAPADPALLHWLQGLNLPAAPAGGPDTTARTAGPTTSAAQPDTQDAVDAGDATALVPQPGGATSSRAGRDHRVDTAGDRAASARDLQAQRGEVVAQAETARAVESAAPRFQDTLAALRAPSAEAAAGAAAAAGPATNAAPPDPMTQAAQAAQASLPVPLDDPQFPRAFGVQVSMLARDGVQRAELHLNPAETGPVSIQIVMDGTQARIDFGADAAPTRAMIEQSLPDLAAALREAGLTLAGGGVSQHAGGRDTGGAAGDPQRSGFGGTARTQAPANETSARLPRRTVTAGGVDLYA
jgi:flagellar hook-length control protein FliK